MFIKWIHSINFILRFRYTLLNVFPYSQHSGYIYIGGLWFFTRTGARAGAGGSVKGCASGCIRKRILLRGLSSPSRRFSREGQNLAAVILQMKTAQAGGDRGFPFVERGRQPIDPRWLSHPS